ncbi:MAG: helix-turn-helix transcriptional regulator [Clostridia bacterium]|nr:helix-turn-helix transcriptional regulator [Clostridia bacterium]
MAAEYLPGTPGERIRDLRKEAKLNQDEFAEAIGISRSTLGDIELDKRSISSTTALEIAKYFNVSVDFVLAKTDDPNVINYDLKVLGLTQEAADKLYTNQIDTGVLNLLIEHEKFGELMHLIAFYLKDINAEAKRTQNALYSTIADFLRKYGEDENADTVAAKKEPVYSADISKIQNCLNIILKETKDKLGDNTKEFHKEMKATVTELMKDKMRTNGALRKINAEEFAGDVVNVITKSIPLPQELTDNLRDALVPIFKADWRGIKK